MLDNKVITALVENTLLSHKYTTNQKNIKRMITGTNKAAVNLHNRFTAALLPKKEIEKPYFKP
ncbi:MAG: hypothetical protein K2N61_07530 [Lachnospiraceae bacterium]|nr:hypothetical protein [Lachnospiraceae bacterium]